MHGFHGRLLRLDCTSGRSELVELTTGPDSDKRCLGLLIAPPLTGVSAFAGMAAPLGETDIAQALEWDQRVLLLSITGANGAACDLILLNCELSAMMLDDFRRSVSFAIYAPPKGDHFSMGHHALTELVTVLAHLQPEAVVALGNANINECLAEVCDKAKIAPRTITESTNDLSTEFREYVKHALQSWSSSTKVES